MRRSFAGVWCVITGAASGIGLEIARILASQGAYLFLLDKDPEALERIGSELGGLTEVQARCVDLSEEKAVTALFEGDLGSVDIGLLVNNAGILSIGGYSEVALRDYRRVMDVNLFSLVHLSQRVASSMVDRGRGAIVNVASVSGVIGFAKLTAYSTSKFAVVGFSQALRAELKGTGVTVGVVCPGLVRTPIARGAGVSSEKVSSVEKLLEKSGADPRMVAKRVIRAAQRGESLVFPDRPAKVLAWLQRLSPGSASSWLHWFSER